MRTRSMVFASSTALAVAFTAAWSVLGASRGGCSDDPRSGASSPAPCSTGFIQVRFDVPGCAGDVMVRNDAIDRVRHPPGATCGGRFPDALPTMRLDTAYEVLHRSESMRSPR